VGIASLEAHADLTLQADGEATKTGSESVTVKMSSGGTTIFYTGTRVVTGSFSYYKPYCSAVTKRYAYSKSTGKAQSWTIPYEGGVFCKSKPATSSMAYMVKQWC
jgi:hypothetical protein